MKKVILILITVLLLSVFCFGYQFFTGVAGMIEADDIKIAKVEEVNTIDDIVQPYIEHDKTKGLSIGIYDNGQVTYHNYGICSDENPVPPTNQSIYEIGSITKTFTATVLVQMVQEGKVKYDDPISMYLPKEVVNWSSDSLTITLEELATHRSGLPRLPNNHLKGGLFNINNPYKNYSEQDLYDYLKSYTPKPKDKRKVNYSNLGMGLLGNILAMVENSSYEELIQSKITGPLGMNNTYAGFKNDIQLTGYNGFGQSTPAWEFQTLGGAGNIRSCTEDMMQYLLANIEARQPFVETHKFRADFGKKSKIGLGWIIFNIEDTGLELHFHDGGSGGFRSAILFSEEHQMGVIALANSIQSVDEIGIRIMELIGKEKSVVNDK